MSELTKEERKRRRDAYVRQHLPVPENLRKREPRLRPIEYDPKAYYDSASRMRLRKQFIARGLPVPEGLQKRTNSFPIDYDPNAYYNTAARFRLRQQFKARGLPIPEGLQKQAQASTQTPKTGRGMPFADFQALPWNTWHRFRVVDQCGDAWAYENRPTFKVSKTGANSGSWSAPGRCEFLGEVNLTGIIWRETLQEKQ